MDRMESAPRWILCFLGTYLAVHLLSLYLWHSAGLPLSTPGTSGNSPGLFETGLAGAGLWLCLVALRSFPAGTPFRRVWMLLAVAAAAQVAPGALGALRGTLSLSSGVLGAGFASPGWMERMERFALLAGGPLRLALLAAAMLPLLRILRKFGFRVRASAAGRAVFGIFCLFTLCRFCEAGAASLAGGRIGSGEWISLAGLPILCVLFLEAMLLRRAVAGMGNGLIARAWIALVFAVLLTGAGEAALWAIPHYPQSLPLAMFGTLIEISAAAAFALVPACQVAAQLHAVNPAGSRPADLATGVPALAR
jgi:hypothetical protein